MMDQKPKKQGFFSKIETEEDARKTIKETAIAFYVLGGLQIILSTFIGVSAIIDGALYVIFAFWLQKSNSRIVAVILLVLSGIGLIVTAINRFGGGQGGRNIFLALVVMWASIRAVQATFKLQSLPMEQQF